MALIDGIIPTQNFELVRSRIAEILAEEIRNQYVLTGNEDLNLTIWLERFVPLGAQELPAIIVSLSNGTLDGHTQIHTDGTYSFNVDVYYKAKTTDDADGDNLATVKLHKTLGICRAILENPKYKTLAFTPPFIMNRHCEGIAIANSSQQGMDGVAMGRLVLSVKVGETVELIDADLIGALYTSVKLSTSEQGYYYEYGATPTPPAPPTARIFADNTSVPAGTTVELGWIATGVTNVSITTLGQKTAIGYQDVIINSTTTFIITATNAGGTVTDSVTITIAAACADGTVNVNGNLFGAVASGGILNVPVKNTAATNVGTIGAGIVTVPDATAVLKDTVGNVLSTTDIASGDSDDITAPNGTVNILNTTPTLIQTVIVRSGETKDSTLSDIALTINDQDGNLLSSSSEKAAVNITKAVTVPVTLIPTIAVDDASPDTNVTINFTGGCTNGTPTNWLWSFGDGFYSTDQNPTHEYEADGVHDVTLSITDGASDGFLIQVGFITVTLQGLAGTPYAWYKAGSGASPSNMTLVSGNVSQWNDESGNGFHITQATVGNRPSYTDDVVNGYGVITFQGVTSCLFRADVAMSRPAVQTIMMFIQRLEAGVNADHFTCAEPSNSASALYTDQAQGFKGYNGGGVMAQYQPSLLNAGFIVTYVQNGANSYVKINRATPLSTALTTGANTSTGIVIGANASKLSNPNFLCAEVIVFNSALSAGDIDNNLNYFNSKFNLHLHE